MMDADWWRRQGISMGLLVVGVVFIVVGIVIAVKESEGDEVVVTLPTPSPTQAALVVDIGGAITKPGVYTIAAGSRVADLIATAGGFTKEADVVWVNRTLNQALLLKDSQKIHIPLKGEVLKEEVENTSGKISINAASQEELESLWGVGAVRAKQIIDNRPYSTLEELVTKAQLSQDILDKNQETLQL